MNIFKSSPYKTMQFIYNISSVISILILLAISTQALSSDDPLTPVENVEFLKELSNFKAGTGETLVPKDSKSQKSVKLKMSKVSQWVNSECGNFFQDILAALDYEAVLTCSEKLDIRNLDDLIPAFNKFCEEESKDEFMECVLTPIQTFALKLFRCFATNEPEFKWDVPGKRMLSIQHGALKTIPELLDLIAGSLCRGGNEAILQNGIAMKDQLMKLVTQWKTENENSQGAMLQGMGMCWVQNNAIQPGSTLCKHYANFQYKSIIDCFIKMKQFEDSNSKIFWQVVTMVFDSIMEKDVDNASPTTLEVQRTLFQEFCSQDTPLYYIFNEGPLKDEKITKGKVEL